MPPVGYRYVKFHPADGSAAHPEVRFDDFAQMHAYVLAYLPQKPDGTLLVHLPGWADDQEKQVMAQLGVQVI